MICAGGGGVRGEGAWEEEGAGLARTQALRR